MKLTTRKSMGDSAHSPISKQISPWIGYIYCELGTGVLYQVVFRLFNIYLVKET